MVDHDGPGQHRVSGDQDGHLRRLHFFEQVGAELTPTLQELKHDYLERDRREDVREPAEVLTVVPLPPD